MISWLSSPRLCVWPTGEMCLKVRLQTVTLSKPNTAKTADSSRTFTSTRSASPWSSCSIWYRFSRLCPALTLIRWCHPSTSLLVRTGWRYTDHADGGHTLDSIHVWRPYCRCWLMSASSVAPSSSVNAEVMTSHGKNAKASVLRHIRFTCSSRSLARRFNPRRTEHFTAASRCVNSSR